MAVIGLAAPVAADDQAPPVLANAALDALTASTVTPTVGRSGSSAGGSVLAVDASGLVQDVAPGHGSRWGSLGQGGGGSGAEAGPSAGTPRDAASATGSVMGGSIGRSVSTRSGDSTSTASAAASSPGRSSIGVFSQSGPGFSTSASRSAVSSFAR